MKKLELDMEKWLFANLDRVNQIREQSDKVVILVSGASASGKTYSSNILLDKLESHGHKCLLFSTDNYYKGLARMLAFQVNKNFYKKSLDEELLASHIRSVIKSASFDEKFSEGNIAKLRKVLSDNNYENHDTLLEYIITEFKRANFDEPDAVNLEGLSKDINTLLNNGSIIIPSYSMITSEVELLEENRKYGKDYDVIILDGIYSLNDIVVNSFDSNIQIRNFLDSDNKTLLVRRLKRDIIDGRSSMTPETNLFIALDIVIPAFEKHILEDKEKADFILISKYTLMEAKAPKDISIQEKVSVTQNELESILEMIKDHELINETIESDYFFANSYHLKFEKQHLIRVREVEDKPLSLIHKSINERRLDGKIVRPQQIFIEKGQFGNIYKDMDSLIKSFKKSHFHVLCKVIKKRKEYKIDDVTLHIDRVDGLGFFIEFCVFDRNDINKINALKRKFGLSNKSKVNSCFEEKMNSVNKENELKFLLTRAPKEITTFKKINQSYLNIKSYRNRKKIEKVIEDKLDWSKIHQARLRVVDDECYYLTLKGEGDNSRFELEHQIDYYSYKELLELETIGSISKKRAKYKLNDNLVMEIDIYDNGLILGEVEYNALEYLESEVEDMVNTKLIDAKNVTFDYTYKNYNLAVKGGWV